MSTTYSLLCISVTLARLHTTQYKLVLRSSCIPVHVPAFFSPIINSLIPRTDFCRQLGSWSRGLFWSSVLLALARGGRASDDLPNASCCSLCNSCLVIDGKVSSDWHAYESELVHADNSGITLAGTHTNLLISNSLGSLCRNVLDGLGPLPLLPMPPLLRPPSTSYSPSLQAGDKAGPPPVGFGGTRTGKD